MNPAVSKTEWERLRQSTIDAMPAIIGAVGLPSVLLGYQARTIALLSSVSVLFIEKSRRIGETWALAAHATLTAAKEKTAGGMDAMYISYSQEMTREFIDACAMWARAFSLAAFDTQEFVFDDSDKDGARSIQAFRIRFASGFEIVALSSAPRGLRGKQGLVIIDEAAFVDSLKQLLKAALAFLVWGGQVVVCSTHNGTENEFNVQVQEILGGRSRFAHQRVDFDAALQDGLYQRICLVTGKKWSAPAEAQWREEIIDFYGDGAEEELFCVPSQGSGTWLTAPLIESRMRDGPAVLELELPADFLQRPAVERASLVAPFTEALATALAALSLEPQYAFGFDFARVADLSVGTLMAIEKNLNRCEALTFELRGVPGDEQKTITEMVLRRVLSRLVGAAFDATGMGWTVAEDMGRKFGLREGEDGSGLVWAIKFSQEWYRINMPPLKTAFEDGAITLVKSQPHLSDLRAVKVVRGIPMVSPLREGTPGKKRHGDFAVALALAHFASRMRWVEYAYEPVVQPGGAGVSGTGTGFMKPARDDDGGGWRSPLGKIFKGFL